MLGLGLSEYQYPIPGVAVTPGRQYTRKRVYYIFIIRVQPTITGLVRLRDWSLIRGKGR